MAQPASPRPTDQVTIIAPTPPPRYILRMLEPHQRATRIINEPGTAWFHFLAGRFLGPAPGRHTLALVVQTIVPHTTIHAELQGLLELSAGGALPVVSEFTGAVNLETREITLQTAAPPRSFTGQFSANGRVLVLREDHQPIQLVHEDTLAELS